MKELTHKWFKREAKDRAGLVLQKKDLAIIKAVAEHRFLDTKQILALFSESTPGKKRYLQKRLAALFEHSFLDRPVQQLSYFRPRADMIYALGQAGADLLSAEDPASKHALKRWREKNASVQFPHLWHTMMINDFWVALSLSLPTAGMELLSWRQDDGVRDSVRVRDGKKGGSYRVPVAPDAFFFIRKTVNSEARDFPFFLEADRSTMSGSRFRDKLRAYTKWYEDGGHAAFGIGRKNEFRVLTVAISNERRANLCALADMRGIPKNAQDIASRLFWFGCEKSYTFKKPESLLGELWSPATGGRPRSLL